MLQDIPGYAEYAVTEDGRVWSKPRTDNLDRPRGGFFMRPTPRGSKRYCYVCLYVDGHPRYRAVHRLVLETFVGPCPEGMEACHNNGIRTDNRLENLRWDTHSEDSKDAIWHGTHPGFLSKGRTDRGGTANGCAKLTETDVRWIRYLRTAGVTLHDLAEGFCIGITTVGHIIKQDTWKTV